MDLRVRVLAAVAGVIHDAPFVRRRAMMQCKYYVYVNVNWMRVIPSVLRPYQKGRWAILDATL